LVIVDKQQPFAVRHERFRFSHASLSLRYLYDTNMRLTTSGVGVAFGITLCLKWCLIGLCQNGHA
jgi:hypothetical protein